MAVGCLTRTTQTGLRALMLTIHTAITRELWLWRHHLAIMQTLKACCKASARECHVVKECSAVPIFLCVARRREVVERLISCHRHRREINGGGAKSYTAGGDYMWVQLCLVPMCFPRRSLLIGRVMAPVGWLGIPAKPRDPLLS